MFNYLYEKLFSSIIERRKNYRKPKNIRLLIGVGGFLIGGCGKTPLVINLAKFFLKQGTKTGVALRGYKGKNEKKGGIVLLNKKILMNVRESGDEAREISEEIKELNGIVVIGKNRKRSLSLLEKLKTDVVIIDDGIFTNRFDYNFRFVCMDGNEIKERFFPFGKLKYPLRFIEKVDGIVYIGEEIKNWIYSFNKPIFKANFSIKALINMKEHKEYPKELLKNKEILLFAGIGRPERLYYLIKKEGTSKIERYFFRDHYWYSKKDIEKLKRIGEKFELVITTFKDYVKIKEIIKRDHLPNNWYIIKTELLIKDKNMYNLLTLFN